ncbi:translation initiation factor IF-2 [Prevotella sp. TCVGH]|uniref:translation initiation factor IF-2 n=1 Tax=Prevotella sp. TCVGH TaxID=2182433 RepID=UPI00201DC164|nr:translation initiation factor IF-2 [Prevotella sp. TCVGH]MCL6748633.1 translation initiation factor IF-2 [Prevotella sp. TCVGH]
MSIRLNKALRELNIGLQTAVEFLEKKSELGEVKPELSFKLNDDQYGALVEAFKQDAEVRNQAEKIFQKKPKEKKRPSTPKEASSAPKDNRAEELLKTSSRQQYNPIGKIDLDAIGKTSAAKEPVAQDTTPQASKAAQEPAPKPAAAVSSEPEKKETVKPVEAKVAQPAPAPEAPVQSDAPQKEEKPAPKEAKPASKKEKVKVEKPAEKQAQPKEEEAPQKETEVDDDAKNDGDELFQTKSELKMQNAPKVNVLGKIDLSAINQSTRPKKKTKEERRKEREEKHGGRKKRVRINQERVDINAASKQIGGNGGNNRPNSQESGRNANKKNNRKTRNKNYNQKPLEVNEEEVARQVKETLARLTSKGNQTKKGARYRKEKRDAIQERMSAEERAERKESKILKLTEFVTVSELASMMDVDVNKLIGTLMSVGLMVSINQRLDAETINLVADEFGFKTEYVSAEVQEAVAEEMDDENDLVSRAPIVTVMGHVDHGKTSLLDHIRNTNVIAGEAGGITQHIGAYNVKLENGRNITFLDTPGHEAFTAMRARGTQVTDIAIIIIAADDSVMPTTKEAIAHAQAANVPMVFAINKIDKPGANPDKIREDLAQMNLLVEEWGGKYQCQEISAKKGIGVNELLEKVLLEADMLDLKANPNRRATGSIIESSLDKGRGYVSTVLVSNGTLRVGDDIIAGTSWGRIKAMFNVRNQRIEEAKPAEPAIILGLNGAPTAGDQFHVLETEQEVRDIANKRMQLQREQGLRTQKRLTLSDVSHRIALGSFKELNIIVKGDTDGSIEALSDSFIKMSTEKINVNVIFKSVGQISENDVTLADASDAIIVGFQVRPSAAARKLAEQNGVEINTYSVIYDAIDDVRAAMEGMLDKVKKEVVTGQVEVKQVYKISKVGTVAGALVTEGKVHRSDKARVVRDGIVVHTAPINALKRFKDDVKEVATGFECGISLVNFNDILEGDIIETFTEVEVKQTL